MAALRINSEGTVQVILLLISELLGSDRSLPECSFLATPVSLQPSSLHCLLSVFLLSGFTFSPSFQFLIFLILMSGSFHLFTQLSLLSPDNMHCLEHQLDSLSILLSDCHAISPAV